MPLVNRADPFLRTNGFLLVLSAVKLLLHLPVLHRYGYHNDELYFIACGRHFSFGFVDHPPFVPWMARFATDLFGPSLFGLRIIPALAGCSAVFLTGLLVRRMGGGRFAQGLACAATIIAPVFLRTGNMLAIPSFEPLFWLGCSYLLVRLIQEDEHRLWLWLGLVAGAGLLNKHSMLFFGAGLLVGLLLTPLRKHLQTPWPYLGGAVAFLIFLPNLLWQISNGWPTVGFLVDLNARVMGDIAVFQFLAGQVLYLHPLNTLIWTPGLLFLFASRTGRPYRALGWIFVVVFLLLLVAKSKIYYLAPAYPALFAAGSIAIEQWTRLTRRWLRPTLITALVAGGVALGPVALPLLSINATDRFMGS